MIYWNLSWGRLPRCRNCTDPAIRMSTLQLYKVPVCVPGTGIRVSGERYNCIVPGYTYRYHGIQSTIVPSTTGYNCIGNKYNFKKTEPQFRRRDKVYPFICISEMYSFISRTSKVYPFVTFLTQPPGIHLHLNVQVRARSANFSRFRGARIRYG